MQFPGVRAYQEIGKLYFQVCLFIKDNEGKITPELLNVKAPNEEEEAPNGKEKTKDEEENTKNYDIQLPMETRTVFLPPYRVKAKVIATLKCENQRNQTIESNLKENTEVIVEETFSSKNPDFSLVVPISGENQQKYYIPRSYLFFNPEN